jgi:hypothetical protein
MEVCYHKVLVAEANLRNVPIMVSDKVDFWLRELE